MIGAAIADGARKGDQLFVEGKIRKQIQAMYQWLVNKILDLAAAAPSQPARTA